MKLRSPEALLTNSFKVANLFHKLLRFLNCETFFYLCISNCIDRDSLNISGVGWGRVNKTFKIDLYLVIIIEKIHYVRDRFNNYLKV